MADQFRQWRQEAEARRVSHATNLSNQISESAVDEFNCSKLKSLHQFDQQTKNLTLNLLPKEPTFTRTTQQRQRNKVEVSI